MAPRIAQLLGRSRAAAAATALASALGLGLVLVLAAPPPAHAAPPDPRLEVPLERMQALADRAAQAREKAKDGLSKSVAFGPVSLDPRVAFLWVLRESARGAATGVVATADSELAALGAPPLTADGVTPLVLAGAVRGGAPDGTLVDWSKGEPDRAPRASAELRVEGSGEVMAGADAPLVLTVVNDGKGAVFQVLATLDGGLARREGAERALAGLPVAIGKVEPGARHVRRLGVPIPLATVAGEITLRFVFQEPNGYAPDPVEARLRVREARRPALGIAVRVLDDGSGDSVGNGDGVVQKGEAVDFRISVKNTGASVARGVRLRLAIPAIDGIKVFGDKEFDLGDLAAGEVAERNVNLSVKPGCAAPAIPITAEVLEASAFAVRSEQDLSLKVDAALPQRKIALAGVVTAREKARLLAAADKDARVLGDVPAGARLPATGELGAFVEVEYAVEEGAAGGKAGGPGAGSPAKKRAWIARASVAFEEVTAGGSRPAGGGGGSTGPAPALVIRERFNQPPLIVLSTPSEGERLATAEERIRVRATVKDAEGLSAVRLIVNGAPLPDAVQGLRGFSGVAQAPAPAPGAPGSAPKLAQVDREVALVPGENRIVVEAVDSDGEVTRAEALVVRATREPNVVALVVGIDAWADGSIPALKYAEADAKAVAAFLRSPRSPVKKGENVRLLLGAEATRGAILEAIERHLVAGAAQPEDMALFYFAGHGYAKDGQYYLAAQDSRQASLRTSAIRHGDLQDLWKDIKAERKVFLADACHAGGLEGLRGENPIHDGLVSVAEGKGSVSIMASRGSQSSAEAPEVGHGVFTFALLQGLAGRADTEAGNGDGRVSVKEALTGFLDREVPALARKRGHEQQPKYEIGRAEGELFLTR